MHVKGSVPRPTKPLVSKAFGKRAFKARQALSSPGNTISQSWVGERIGVTGVTIGSWEAGKTEPDFETVERLAEVLGTTPEWLAFGIATIPYKEGKPGDPGSVPVIGTANENEKPRGE